MPNIIVLGNETINLEYFISENKRTYTRHTNTRETITLKHQTQKLDKRATNRAKIPNIIHNSDSVYARKVIIHTPMYVVHDEFLVPALTLCTVIDHINAIFPTYLPNKDYVDILDPNKFENAYNIFIII
jgi:hypothetical protein